MHRQLPTTRSLVATIERAPFDLNAWSELAQCLQVQQDTLSAKSVWVILGALKKIDPSSTDSKATIAAPSPAANSLFIRLARSYNNPDLLKRAGNLFLEEWKLPAIASTFFERAANLNGLEVEPPISGKTGARNQEQLTKTKTLEPLPTFAEEPTSELGSPSWQQPFTTPDLNVLLKKSGRCHFPRVSKLVQTPPPATEASLSDLLTSDSNTIVAEASVALNRGDLTSALSLLEQASDQPLEPRRMWQAWSNYGQVSYEHGNYAEMEKGYRKALRFEPAIIASHFNLGLALQLNLRFNEAERFYLLADRIQPDNPRVWSNLGSLYFQTEQMVRAESAFRHSLKIDPNYARAWDNLAATLGAQNRVVEAKEACENAIRLRPNFPETYFKLGMIYFHEEELDPAREAFTQSAALPELAAASNCFLAMIHARRQEFGAAQRAIAEAEELRANPNTLSLAWSDLGKAYAQNGKMLQAAESFRAATALKPNEPDLWVQLGDAYSAAGEKKEAHQNYLRAGALKAGRNQHRQSWNLVDPDVTNDWTKRSEVIRKEIARNPDLARNWYDLGVCLQTENRSKEACEAFAKAYELENSASNLKQLTR